MNAIQQAKEYLKTYNDVQLLDEHDLYLNIKNKNTEDLIYQQLIENELNERDLLAFKLNEDLFEMQSMGSVQ
jgi:hypothetical protein